MNQDEIISMANQCGLPLTYVPHDDTFSLHVDGLVAFASLVSTRAAAIEREACAKVCESEAEYWEQYGATGHVGALGICARDIRARGDQHE